MRRAYQIRPAIPDDAEPIYDLTLNAFGQRYLSYTIYQSRLSVSYLRELITLGYESSKHRIVVAVHDGHVRGYYEALRRGGEFFLNYIAIETSNRHNGLGSTLLCDFEEFGHTLGCTRYVLDVFDSNPGAREWYERRGYTVVSSCYIAQVPINGLLADDHSVLAWLPKRPAAAFEEECARGFSKAEYVSGACHITIGLIDGRVCKLLAYDGVSQDGALHIVADLCPDRALIIVPDLHEIPATLSVYAAEKSVQLAKPVSIQ